MSRPRRTPVLLATLLFALVAPGSLATVPGQISYQGLLLDDQGAPVNGMVDLVFTLFDAVTAGTQLWTESHADVPVLDGVYDVVLGETTAITPEIVSGGALYLEIEVDTETLTPRQRLVAVPYALEAGSVDGVSSVFVSQVFEHVDWDGGLPPNDDPSEGFGDPDGDGLANFIDPDNDGDALPDVAEVAAGTDINLVTPTITGFSPTTGEASVTGTVEVQGTNFAPGLTVVFGSEAPVASNVMPVSFDVDVGPQPVGTVPVQVTLANGEQAASSFDFVENVPTITSFVPSFVPADVTSVVTVFGTNFFPGLAVQFGSETPTPMNVTATSFEVSVGPQPAGQVTVTVSYASGNQDSALYTFLAGSGGARVVFVSSQNYDGNQGGVAGAHAACQSLATAALLPGLFLAWLSDGLDDPATGFIQAGGPFELENGTQVADDWADLIDGTLDAAINRTELGGVLASTVWSHVAADGTHATGNPATGACNGWTSNVGTGRAGSTTLTTSGWTDGSSFNCSTSRPIFCFQQ